MIRLYTLVLALAVTPLLCAGEVAGRHPRPATAGCYKPPTQDIREVSSSGIYRWTDERGQVHFSDRPQQQAQDLSGQYRARLQGVKVSFDYPGWPGDAALEADIRAEASLLYRILTSLIPQQAWRQINLNITLFQREQDYEDFKRTRGANANWGAFYSSYHNQMFMVRYPRTQQVLHTARHEMTHAMLAGMLGTVPVWLNEGLAQYFEGVDWQMSSASIRLNVRELHWLQQHQTTPAMVFDLTPVTFNDSNQERNYRQSSVLVYFLMSHDEGRGWLRRILSHYVQNPCDPFDSRGFLSRYPGGRAGFERHYRQWLEDARPQPHYY